LAYKGSPLDSFLLLRSKFADVNELNMR